MAISSSGDGLFRTGNGATPARPGQALTQAQLLDSLGQTGLRRWGGWVQDESLPEFYGRRWRDTVREMMRDPTLASALFAVEMLTRQVDWYNAPAETEKESDQALAQDISDFMDTCLFDMSNSWEDTLAEVLSFLPFGWMYAEIVYKKRQGSHPEDARRNSKFDDGRWGWRKIQIRAQETLDHWEFDDDGGIQGMWQMGAPDWQLHYIPIDKALLFRTKPRKGNPEGDSLFYPAYRPWYFKRNIENIEAIGIERDLAGLPVMKVPGEILMPDAQAAQVALRNQLEQLVTRVRNDEQAGLLIPSDYDENGHPQYEFQLLSGGGAKQFNTDQVIARKAMEMLAGFLADFMLLGHEKVGTFSLSTSKISLFVTALGAFLDSIAEVISEFGYTRLMVLNGWDTKLRPTLKHGKIEARDLVELSTFLTNLAQAGAPIFPNPDLMSFLMEQADLPAPPEEEADFTTSPEDPMAAEEPNIDEAPATDAGANAMSLTQAQAAAATSATAAAAPPTDTTAPAS